MKKRWGKPITQVQRFVPQYCQTPCDTYSLRPLNAADISGESDFNKVRFDINHDGHIDVAFTERIGNINGSGPIETSNVTDVTDFHKDYFYEWLYSDGGESPRWEYNSKYYKHLKVSVNLYIYESKIYTGEKNPS